MGAHEWGSMDGRKEPGISTTGPECDGPMAGEEDQSTVDVAFDSEACGARRSRDAVLVSAR